ncbi:MAG: DegT/DnrJ/EryC1/StrS family aminotransferase [Magnetococcales bacterium]|nr:DegT/DnrJ/EryC1/StrS family aminotransferase [Magnetococcales bacterium]
MPATIPFLDLRVSDAATRQRLLAAVERVLLHGRMILGPEVTELEEKMAGFLGRRFALSVGSGSAALFLALRALGLGPGDEVITTSLSWIATANAIAMTGATPVFADIRDDLNIDPDSVARLITPRTRAILPVHYTGKIAPMEALQALAARNDLLLVEDAAQAFGAKQKGRPAGSFGILSCFSMNSMKVFASCGEAGLITTDGDSLHEKLLALRYNGTVNRETCLLPGLNDRMDTLQAAILLERFKDLPELLERRRTIAARYRERLRGVVGLPEESPGCQDAWYTFTVRAERRDALQAFLSQTGIETKIQHPILMPHQPAYRQAPRDRLSNAERLVEHILCLPAHEKMSPDQVDAVAERIVRFYDRESAS